MNCTKKARTPYLRIFGAAAITIVIDTVVAATVTYSATVTITLAALAASSASSALLSKLKTCVCVCAVSPGSNGSLIVKDMQDSHNTNTHSSSTPAITDYQKDKDSMRHTNAATIGSNVLLVRDPGGLSLVPASSPGMWEYMTLRSSVIA